eukprot:TRINITY_DN12014_c0_g1_i1.p1 TRINITY_DN12014_c0_g1~~TRINITY_DN12014_c0_g1_i1.p1  ORF type:complete len:301 (-),score=83.40 TRINITY_DN12014_c0_g1_i1:23-925(-)
MGNYLTYDNTPFQGPVTEYEAIEDLNTASFYHEMSMNELAQINVFDDFLEMIRQADESFLSRTQRELFIKILEKKMREGFSENFDQTDNVSELRELLVQQKREQSQLLLFLLSVIMTCSPKIQTAIPVPPPLPSSGRFPQEKEQVISVKIKQLLAAHVEDPEQLETLVGEWMEVFSEEENLLKFIVEEYKFLLQHSKHFNRPLRVKSRVEFWEYNLFEKIEDPKKRKEIREKRSGTIMTCVDRGEAMNVITRTLKTISQEAIQTKQNNLRVNLQEELSLALQKRKDIITTSETSSDSYDW